MKKRVALAAAVVLVTGAVLFGVLRARRREPAPAAVEDEGGSTGQTAVPPSIPPAVSAAERLRGTRGKLVESLLPKETAAALVIPDVRKFLDAFARHSAVRALQRSDKYFPPFVASIRARQPKLCSFFEVALPELVVALCKSSDGEPAVAALLASDAGSGRSGPSPCLVILVRTSGGKDAAELLSSFSKLLGEFGKVVSVGSQEWEFTSEHVGPVRFGIREDFLLVGVGAEAWARAVELVEKPSTAAGGSVTAQTRSLAESREYRRALDSVPAGVVSGYVEVERACRAFGIPPAACSALAASGAKHLAYSMRVEDGAICETVFTDFRGMAGTSERLDESWSRLLPEDTAAVAAIQATGNADWLLEILNGLGTLAGSRFITVLAGFARSELRSAIGTDVQEVFSSLSPPLVTAFFVPRLLWIPTFQVMARTGGDVEDGRPAEVLAAAFERAAKKEGSRTARHSIGQSTISSFSRLSGNLVRVPALAFCRGYAVFGSSPLPVRATVRPGGRKLADYDRYGWLVNKLPAERNALLYADLPRVFALTAEYLGTVLQGQVGRALWDASLFPPPESFGPMVTPSGGSMTVLSEGLRLDIVSPAGIPGLLAAAWAIDAYSFDARLADILGSAVPEF